MNDDNLLLELGDIICVKSPSNVSLHDKNLYVSYIDVQNTTTWIDIDSFESFTIEMNNGGFNSNSSIENIFLINRSPVKGYAKQNGLIVGVWIDIYLGEHIITGFITNLTEDMIEITSLPENDKLYIDFKYQGIPTDIPIKNICIRNAPKNNDDVNFKNSDDNNNDDIIENYDNNNDDFYEIAVPKNYRIENYRDNIHKLLENLDVDEFYGSNDDYENSSVSHHQLYNIQAQLNHLYDDFISRVPDKLRTVRFLKNIKNHVYRFE